MKQLLTHALLVGVCVYLVLGTGRITLFESAWVFKLAINTLYLYGTALLFVRFRALFWFLFFPFFIFLAFYAPVGLTNGAINEHFVLAIFGTYMQEAGEFFSTLPVNFILISAFSIAFVLYFKSQKHTKFDKKHLYVYVGIFIVFTIFSKHLSIYTARSFKQAVTTFADSYQRIQAHKDIQIKSEWQIISASPKYKNYILIIGESARRDYHEIYGYKVKNNPFLSSTNGIFVDGFNSVGLNTIPSLSATLNHKQNRNLNVVDLANDAGFETFWLSNQGYLGDHDTPITAIAKHAHHQNFIQKDGNLKYDSDLLVYFAEIFKQPSVKNRMIFLHFYGSHPDVCRRLSSNEYKKYPDKESFEINCYVESIRQTDANIKQIHKILTKNLNNTGENFSLIYFSDHGLTHVRKNGKNHILMSSEIGKEHLQIPLLKISNDDTNRTFIKNESYQNYFAQSFAKWLGIKVLNFSEISDIFEPVRQVDILNSRQNLIKNHSGDPAIDISRFKD